MKFVREEKNGWEYYHVPELTARGIIHGFFTRNSPSFIGWRVKPGLFSMLFPSIVW